MGKFFNGKVRKDRGTLIKYGIIAAGVLLIIILFVLISAGKNKNKDVVLELNEVVTVEVNGEYPAIKDYFSKFENFDEKLVDITDFDITTVGEYTVTVTAEGYGSEDITVNVIDTTAPELVLKNVEIESGDTYYIEDFIHTCEDNSNTECIVEYYTESFDQTGNPIDYSSFTEDGKYLIKIIAKDESDNTSDPKDVYLTIGNDEQPVEPEPVTCTYGDLTINRETHYYPIAVVVGDQINNCALNRDLWDSATIQAPVKTFYQNDYERLKIQIKAELEKEFPKGAKIVAYPHFIGVLNAELKGLVGYAVYVKVYVAPADTSGQVDSDENLRLAYYLRSDKTREYEINKYNLAE
ncbi:MAG: hypothetical protein E7164_03235 [Firmicutes bacterium]|nr:hypothetical protein [Bacillota bacterium]